MNQPKIDSPGKNKEKGMAEDNADTNVQNPTLKQHGDNTKTEDNPRYSSALSQRKQQ